MDCLSIKVPKWNARSFPQPHSRKVCSTDYTVWNQLRSRTVAGLPDADPLHIVSLLGRKKDGYSEFSYYPFYSMMETDKSPTFQEWLDSRYERTFVVHEFPTIDAQGVPRAVLNAVTMFITPLLRNDSTVVLIDSAGAERTARVCEAMGYMRVTV